MEIGEIWAHRSRRQDPLAKVRVEAIGEKRPVRVKVRFLDDAEEGRVDWVPPSQLKSPWDRRHEYLHLDGVCSELTSPFKGRVADEDEASQWIFDGFIDRHVANRLSGRRSGVTEVRDWAALGLLSGLSQDDLGAGVQLEGTGAHLLPWPAAVTIAKAYLKRNAARVLEDIHHHVQEDRRTGASGYYVNGTNGEPDRYIGPSTRNFHLEIIAPIESTLRNWAGAERVREVDEIRELRNALAKTTAVLNETVLKLVKAGQHDLAWTIHHSLYPDADRKRWRSALKKQAEASNQAEAEWLTELHERNLAIKLESEIATARLYGTVPPEWTWSERIEPS